MSNRETILKNPFGVNVDSIADTAHHILGVNPKEICARFPQDYRILHAESCFDGILQTGSSIVRTRSASSFSVGLLRSPASARGGGQNWGPNRKDDLIEYLVRPRLTFHATLRQQVGSIVRYDFLKSEN